MDGPQVGYGPAKRLAAVVVIAGSLGGAIVHPAGSSTKDLAMRVDSSAKLGTLGVSPDERRAFAEALRDYWRSYSNRIPRPSPAEVKWIMDEWRAGGERANAILNRKEFSLWELGLMAEPCAENSELLVKSVVGSDKKAEVFYWFKMLGCIHEAEHSLSRLHHAGLSNGRYDGPFYMATTSLWVKFIVDSIAIELLRPASKLDK